jgi:hypothetical protein
MLYWIILFIVSYLTKSIIIGNLSNLNHNLNKIYSALLVLSVMATADSLMYDSKNAFMFFLLAIVMVFFIKDQIFIDDDQYLSSLIEFHQQSIDMSNKIKDKTENQLVKEIANKIVSVYPQEIATFKSQIKTYRPFVYTA